MIDNLTQEEANRLINTLKKFIGNTTFIFPAIKEKIEFDVVGERRGEEFVVNIQRKVIVADKCTYQGRIKSNNIILLRLDLNPTAVHTNPDGTKINGTHLHIYSEKNDYKEAIPFNVDSDDLYDVCCKFFEEFHIIEPPRITYQPSLFK